jgi:glycosyltransferase involved in cell wall biosynthesis
MDALKKLSIITTCKDRLEHLKISLPLFLGQSNAEVIVVDYGCVQGTSSFMKENYPDVKVVKVENISRFNLAKARNIGAANALNEVLVFCDADTILHQDIGLWIQDNFIENNFYITPNWGNGTTGTFIISSVLFFKTGGYDEAFDAWGGEDTDLYDRIELLGFGRMPYPSGFVTSISHSDEIRQLGVFYGAMPSRDKQRQLCQLYRKIKNEIMKLEGVNLNLDCRIDIMAQVKSFFKNSIPSGDAIEISYSLKEGLGHKKTYKFTIK